MATSGSPLSLRAGRQQRSLVGRFRRRFCVCTHDVQLNRGAFQPQIPFDGDRERPVGATPSPRMHADRGARRSTVRSRARGRPPTCSPRPPVVEDDGARRGRRPVVGVRLSAETSWMGFPRAVRSGNPSVKFATFSSQSLPPLSPPVSRGDRHVQRRGRRRPREEQPPVQPPDRHRPDVPLSMAYLTRRRDPRRPRSAGRRSRGRWSP